MSLFQLSDQTVDAHGLVHLDPLYTPLHRENQDHPDDETSVSLEGANLGSEDTTGRSRSHDVNLRVEVSEDKDELVVRIFWQHVANCSQYILYLLLDSCNVDETYPHCDVPHYSYEPVIPAPQGDDEVRIHQQLMAFFRQGDYPLIKIWTHMCDYSLSSYWLYCISHHQRF